MGNVLIWFLCAVAFLKVSQKIDSFMASLGVNVGHTGGSLMAEALIATRGIAMVAGMAGHAIGGVGRRSSGGTAFGSSGAQGVGGYFKGGLAGMASRRAANNAVKTATNNTTIHSPHTQTSRNTSTSSQGAAQGAQGPIPAQASTMAQAPRLTDQSKAAPTFHSSETPGNAATTLPTHLTPPNEPTPVGGAVSVPAESEEQHPIILTDGAPAIGSVSGGMTDASPDTAQPGSDVVIDNSEQSAALTEQQTSLQEVLPIDECTFIGDKAFDEKHVYSTVRELYHGDAVIPLNKRNTKDPAKLPSGNPICEAGLAMHKDGKTRSEGRLRQKFCCPFAHIAALAVACAAVMNNSRHSYRSAKALRRAG